MTLKSLAIVLLLATIAATPCLAAGGGGAEPGGGGNETGGGGGESASPHEQDCHATLTQATQPNCKPLAATPKSPTT